MLKQFIRIMFYNPDKGWVEDDYEEKIANSNSKPDSSKLVEPISTLYSNTSKK